MELSRHHWPEPLQGYQELKGVFVGGCYKRGEGSRFRAKAHTHYKEGRICILSPARLAEKMLLLHELAHVLAPGGHDDKWRAKLLEIGGTLDEVPGLLRSYRKNGGN